MGNFAPLDRSLFRLACAELVKAGEDPRDWRDFLAAASTIRPVTPPPTAEEPKEPTP